MGKIIRRTVTITTTETWTIVWLPEDKPQNQASTIVQGQSKTKEEPDETFQTALNGVDPGKPSVNESPLPLSTVVTTRPATRHRSRRIQPPS